MADIPESEWKLFRALCEAALDRSCAGVLEESAAIIADERATSHERYGRLFGPLAERDRSLAGTFDSRRCPPGSEELGGPHDPDIAEVPDLLEVRDVLRDDGGARSPRGQRDEHVTQDALLLSL